MAAGGFGSASSAAGSIFQANADYQQGKAEAKLYGLNQRVALWQAKDATLRGTIDASAIRDRVAGILGGQATGFAGMNVALDSGAPLDVSADTARIAALDQMTALNNAARAAFGFKVDASNSQYQGAVAKWAGKQKAIGDLLSGAGSAAAMA